MTSKLILEFRFTFHQKLVILISVAVLILLIITYIIEIFQLDDLLLIYTLIISYPLLIILALLKKGFLTKERKLFKSYFFLGFGIFNSEVNTNLYPKVTVLQFKKIRKLPWFSIAQPDAATDYNSFEINVLNESHTQRNIIIELKKQKNVKSTIDFLTAHTDLVFEKYSPKSRRTKRKRRR
jgi:uncharacterized membrane protein YoaT (DUF817 family)